MALAFRAMSSDLDGNVVAITGASSGIGEATALACARAGAAVALGARRTDRLRDVAARIAAEGGRAGGRGTDRLRGVAARIAQEGGRAEALEADVAHEASARAFVEGAAERLGRL